MKTVVWHGVGAIRLGDVPDPTVQAQAGYARIPYADVGPVWLPEEVGDDAAIMLSDIHPTVWSGARRESGWTEVVLDPSA